MSRPFGTVFGYSAGKLERHPQVRLITELFLSILMEEPHGDTRWRATNGETEAEGRYS